MPDPRPSPPRGPGRTASLQERRRAQRFAFETAIQWRAGEQSEVSWRAGGLLELSADGACFTTGEPIAIGKRISLQIPAPRTDRSGQNPISPPMIVSGEIVEALNRGDGTIRYDVKFERMFFMLAEWARLGNVTSP